MYPDSLKKIEKNTEEEIVQVLNNTRAPQEFLIDPWKTDKCSHKNEKNFLQYQEMILWEWIMLMALSGRLNQSLWIFALRYPKPKFLVENLP